MNQKDQTYLRDMLMYSRDAVEFMRGKTISSLNEDRLLARAITYTVGIIGEAASHVSQEVRDTYPQIPWPQVIAMRNRLFHGYNDVNYERLWNTVMVAIPSLIEVLEAVTFSSD
jgi:uncharacterized protein with HEPN domain